MKIAIEEIRMKEPIQLGPSATNSINTNEMNPQRSAHRLANIELDDVTGIVSVEFRGKKKHISAGNWTVATEKGTAEVVKAEVQAQEDDEDEVPDLPLTGQEELDDMPDDIPGKVAVKRGPGRPRVQR